MMCFSGLLLFYSSTLIFSFMVGSCVILYDPKALMLFTFDKVAEESSVLSALGLIFRILFL